MKHLMSKPHARGVELTLGRKVAKQIADQNCFWPVTQVMADKLLTSSKRLIRYIALYSMAGVAMETRLFRIHPSSRDTTFVEACAAFLTPKMSLSQVMPSGCHLRRVALPPANQPALSDRPSASDYPEEQLTITPEEMRVAVTTPVFQPYRGASGRAWMAKEYGLTMDTSSLMSSETERDDTDDEIVSFDLGPEPYEPDDNTRLPSDEWLDDHQQGLHPGSSEPRYDPFDSYKAMPNQISIMDMMRSDMETSELNKAPPPRARAPAQTVRWDFDFVRDEPPPVRRVQDSPMETSTPRAELRTQNVRPTRALERLHPRASSAPPAEHPAKRAAIQYSPVKEEITPPVTPPRAQNITPVQDPSVVPETPSPIAKPGRSRGRGTWRAPQTATLAPGVGTRSQTRHRELQEREEEEAQVASARWPPSPDLSEDIVHLTREMHIRDAQGGAHAELERAYPSGEEGTGARSRQPPAAGLISRQQDTYLIPPPSRAVGGARGHSVPVSTATLGLIHRQDPALAALLREEPETMMSRRTRLRVYSTMRLIRTGLIGQMASLQQWEDAMRGQDE